MKANLRFLFTVILFFCVGVLSLTTIVNTQKAQYEGNGYHYVSNNRKGTPRDAAALLVAFPGTNARLMGSDDSGSSYLSDFSRITLSKGRVPNKPGEYIVPEGKSGNTELPAKAHNVGEYKETFGLNGVGRIYKLSAKDRVAVTNISLDRAPDSRQRSVLKRFGFIKVDAQNVDRKINAEMYDTIGLILKIFSGVLLCVALVSWVSFLAKQANDAGKQLEVFGSFGANMWGTVVGYCYLQHRNLVRVAVEAFVFYNAVAVVARVVTGASWFVAMNAVLLVSAFLVLVSVVVALCVKMSTMRGSRIPTCRALPYVLLAAGVVVGVFLSSPFMMAICAVVLVVMMLVKAHSPLTKALFSRMGTVSAALLVVLSMLIMVNVVIMSIWKDSNGKEDKTVQTSMPYQAEISVDSLPTSVGNAQDYHKHAHINPVNGVELNGRNVYPLINSTDLSRYEKYCSPSNEVKDDSVLIGRVLAKKASAHVGSRLVINDVQLRVTHIVDSEQYAGMIVYLSDSTFDKAFGDTGNTFYGTDLDVNELKKYFADNQIQTKSQYRAYYRNSVTQLMAMLYTLGAVVLAISVFVAYRIFAVFIDFITWKLNVMRGFGISFAEYLGNVFIECMTVVAASFFAVFIVINPVQSYLTNCIFDVTDSYFPVAYDDPTLLLTVTEFLVLVGVVAVVSWRGMGKKSVYQQYLQTAVEG